MSNDPAVKSTRAPVEDAFLTPGQLYWLKIAVVVMGLIILGLMGAIITRIIAMAKSKPEPAPAAVSTPLPPPLASISMALPPGAIIRSIAPGHGTLAVHHTTDGKDAIVILDLATGRVVSRVGIERREQ
jgi:hypothetical protein